MKTKTAAINPMTMTLCSSAILLLILCTAIPAHSDPTPEFSISNTVETLCPILKGANDENPLSPVEQDLLFRCGEVKIKTAAGQTFDDLTDEQFRALGHMTAEETDTMETVTVEFFNSQMSAIINRMAALRAGGTGNLALNTDQRQWPAIMLAGPVPAGALNESPPEISAGFGKLGVFLSGSLSTGNRDATTIEPGFDFDSHGITGGADYRLTQQLVVGLAFGFMETEADIDGNTGDLEVDGYSFSLYSTYYQDQFYIDLIGTYGTRDYDTVRNLRYGINVNPNDPNDPNTTLVDQTFIGEADADEYAFSLGTGYDLVKDNITYGPYARINYSRTDIDSYQERLGTANTNAGFGLPLAFEDQEITSFSSSVGFQASAALNTRFGVLLPHLRADWEHEFDNDTDAIRARFIHGSATEAAAAANLIIIPTEDPDEDFFNLATGISMVLPRGVMVYVDYATVLGLTDITYHQFTGGLRIEFS